MKEPKAATLAGDLAICEELKIDGCYGTWTDRELARLYRSSLRGAETLYQVFAEMDKRGLLRPRAKGAAGYPKEFCRRISDYPIDQKTGRTDIRK